MFKRMQYSGSEEVTVFVEDRPVQAAAGDTVAAAVFSAGGLVTRISSVSGEERGPFCLMGVCYECLVEIDGKPNQQACRTTVKEGMRIKLQRGMRKLK